LTLGVHYHGCELSGKDGIPVCLQFRSVQNVHDLLHAEPPDQDEGKSDIQPLIFRLSP